MARVRLLGTLLQTLLTIEDIANIDQPPQPDVSTSEACDLILDNVPPLNGVAEDAPVIGIIDSGVNNHPFLADVLVGAIGVPATLGSADDFGHGTRVGGVAVLATSVRNSPRARSTAAAVYVRPRSSTTGAPSRTGGWSLPRCGRR
jgi:hypothetical protein